MSDEFSGRRITLMGLGSFGGGTGAARFLLQRGAQLTISDRRPPDDLATSLAELNDLPAPTLHLGGHDVDDFLQADLIVASPAVRRDHPCLVAARSAGIPVTSEMNLFWERNPAPVVAITGSNGKSTTTAMTAAILEQSGRRVWLGGNLGTSLLPCVDDIRPNDVVVLELSSFQLFDLDAIAASPQVAVVTNFSPNHLDWHDTLDAYRLAKQTILRHQTERDFAVLNRNDTDVAAWPVRGERHEFGFVDSLDDAELAGQSGVWIERNAAVSSQHAVAQIAHQQRRRDVPLGEWLTVPGWHNRANAAAAIAAAIAGGADAATIEPALRSYRALSHRLEWVVDVKGVSYFNDSLATTPESSIVALESFDRPVWLMAGGYDKRVSLSEMATAVAERCAGVALMGQTAPQLQELIAAVPNRGCQISPVTTTFEQAFHWVAERARPGDVVLLSPGCASYDWFRNFAHRGETFRQLTLDFAHRSPNSL